MENLIVFLFTISYLVWYFHTW